MIVNGQTWKLVFESYMREVRYVHRGLNMTGMREHTTCRIVSAEGTICTKGTVARNHKDANNLRIARKKAYVKAIENWDLSAETRVQYLRAYFNPEPKTIEAGS